jgi:uncharacterized membrane protein (UPF0127 family)
MMAEKQTQIRNLTRDTVLVAKGRIADNRWTRLKGLVGVKHLSDGDGLLIKPCKGVHCMFMSIPIDVVYVDRDDRIVGLDENMAPWQVGRIYISSRYAVEMPAGTIARTGTRVGDALVVSGVGQL